MVTVWSSRLGKKHHKHAILIMVIFLRIFKIIHFWKFLKDFLKSSELLAKMVRNILFYQNMVAQTQYNCISPFCDKNVSRLLRTSGFNVKILKLNLTVFL